MNLCNYLFNISLLGGLRVKDFKISIEKEVYPYNIWIQSIRKIGDGEGEFNAIIIGLERYYNLTISGIVFGSLSNIYVDHLRYDFYGMPCYMKISFLGSKYI